MESLFRTIVPNVSSEQLRNSPLLPCKETRTHHTFKLKLQRQPAIVAFFRLQSFRLTTAEGAIRIITKKVACKNTVQAVCMAVPPLVVRMYEPINDAARLKNFPVLHLKTNVLTLDVATSKISFGSVQYSPWTRKRLRHELCEAVERLKANADLKVPPPLEVTSVAAELKNSNWARAPDWDSLE
eukprot:580857-Pleurochrysis_carterae.AAC.2